VVKIVLFHRELRWCQRHAEKIVEHYGGDGNKGSGAYNHNKVSSNLVGVKSEVATKVWLKRHIQKDLIKCNFENFTDTSLVGDININGQSLEIKGLQPYQWDKFKRMVPPRQLHHYVQDNAIIIWTTTSGDTKHNKVALKGWNYASDVQTKGIPIETICSNIWLKEDDLMRNMDSLAFILRSLK